MNPLYAKTLNHLKTKQRILFLTTSNRWSGESGGEKPKSTLLAEKFAKDLDQKPEIIDVTKLKIYPCEGNVSAKSGNSCGLKEANLKDSEKNPSACHRCWASINHADDELWRISRSLLQSDAVVFFGSVRWGQMNSFYQKLIERLTWLENRHSTLKEDNILEDIDAGIIAIGQNWHGKEVVTTQKQVLSFYGFKVIDDLCWHWQFTDDGANETNETYRKAAEAFKEEFLG